MMNRSTVTWVIVSIALCITSSAQDEARRPRQRWLDQPHVAGQISSINGNTIEVLTPESKTEKVSINSDTQFRKDRAPAKLADFKVGDRVFAVGEQQKDGSFLARFVASGFGNAPGGGRMGMSPEDLGKKFIMGEVKKIDETKLTILRPDNVEQVIEADENTSFRNDKGESVTLADIKVGDHVGGRGELKNGIFVPQTLRIGSPQRFGRGPESPAGPK